MQIADLKIEYVKASSLKFADYNPRKLEEDVLKDVEESVRRFGLVDPLIVNSAKERKNIVIGGHARLKIAKKLGIDEVPVVFLNIPELEKEKELNLRLNKNIGEWDLELLAQIDKSMLQDVGFSEKELDDIFAAEKNFPEGSSEDQGRLDQKNPVKCPECGAEFIPQKK